MANLPRWKFYFEFIAEFIGQHCINLNLAIMEEFTFYMCMRNLPSFFFSLCFQIHIYIFICYKLYSKSKEEAPAKSKQNKKHQRQQCAEWCQQMSTLRERGCCPSLLWHAGGVVGEIWEKLLLAITKEIYRYYTAWLHNNTNTHMKESRGKKKKNKRGSKTICIWLCMCETVCVRVCEHCVLCMRAWTALFSFIFLDRARFCLFSFCRANQFKICCQFCRIPLHTFWRFSYMRLIDSAHSLYLYRTPYFFFCFLLWQEHIIWYGLPVTVASNFHLPNMAEVAPVTGTTNTRTRSSWGPLYTPS